MIIDFHVHAFPDDLAPRAVSVLTENINNLFRPLTDGTVSGLMRSMDEYGVDISVLQPVVTKPAQFRKTNEWAAAMRSERLIPFGGLHPDTDDFRRDIDYIVSLGLPGIKLHPEYQNFQIDEPRMLRIYDYALSRGLILLFHAGFDPAVPPPYKSSPKGFANVLDAMRGGVIIAAHLGGYKEWDGTLRYLAGRDIYLDTSNGFEYCPMETFLEIVSAHGAERILFASDSPWSCAGTEIRHLRNMPLTDAEKELILSGNARRLLGINAFS